MDLLLIAFALLHGNLSAEIEVRSKRTKTANRSINLSRRFMRCVIRDPEVSHCEIIRCVS